jgi:hypothetical protein
MDVAAVLFGIAALGGGFCVSLRRQKKKLPAGPAVLHGTLAGGGLVTALLAVAEALR